MYYIVGACSYGDVWSVAGDPARTNQVDRRHKGERRCKGTQEAFSKCVSGEREGCSHFQYIGQEVREPTITSDVTYLF